MRRASSSCGSSADHLGAARAERWPLLVRDLSAEIARCAPGRERSKPCRSRYVARTRPLAVEVPNERERTIEQGIEMVRPVAPRAQHRRFATAAMQGRSPGVASFADPRQHQGAVRVRCASRRRAVGPELEDHFTSRSPPGANRSWRNLGSRTGRRRQGKTAWWPTCRTARALRYEALVKVTATSASPRTARQTPGRTLRSARNATS